MIEAVRLLTLVPMAWGAWSHRAQWIALGPLVLLLAWCNGLILHAEVHCSPVIPDFLQLKRNRRTGARYCRKVEGWHRTGRC